MNPVHPVRKLTAEEAAKVSDARLIAIERCPYLAPALFEMCPLAAEGLGTFAVDARWRCYIDPTLLVGENAEPLSIIGGSLVHEVSHLIRDHAERANALGVHAPVLWNLACDAAINDDLLASGIALPDGVVTPEALSLDPDGIEESYYAALSAAPPPGTEHARPDDGEGCGSGAGDPPASWELADDDDHLSGGLDEARAAGVRERVAAEIAECGGTGRGTVPAGWRRWADEELRPAAVPWRQVLASAVRRAVGWAAGQVDYRYDRPSRRRVPRVITPAMRRPVVSVAVVVDTSGSMDSDQLSAALGEVEGIITANGNSTGLTVLTCDAETSTPATVTRAQAVELVGGGGTDMRVGIAAAEGLRPAPNVIVVFTDGMTPWPEAPTRAHLVVAVTGGWPTDEVPEWATAVSVPATEQGGPR